MIDRHKTVVSETQMISPKTEQRYSPPGSVIPKTEHNCSIMGIVLPGSEYLCSVMGVALPGVSTFVLFWE